MVTRETYEQQRSVRRHVERREGLVLAGLGIGLGLAQLAFLRWADANLDRASKLAIALPLFLGYMAAVAWRLLRFERRRRAAGPRCPGCGTSLLGTSERIAAATGRCDACGSQVID